MRIVNWILKAVAWITASHAPVVAVSLYVGYQIGVHTIAACHK